MATQKTVSCQPLLLQINQNTRSAPKTDSQAQRQAETAALSYLHLPDAENVLAGHGKQAPVRRPPYVVHKEIRSLVGVAKDLRQVRFEAAVDPFDRPDLALFAARRKMVPGGREPDSKDLLVEVRIDQHLKGPWEEYQAAPHGNAARREPGPDITQAGANQG